MTRAVAKRAASLQRRLGVGLALGVTVLWLLAMAGAGYVVRHELDEAFDSALQETAQRLLPLAVEDILEREDRTEGRRVTALGKHDKSGEGFWDRRRPRFLLSGLVKCGACGSGFVKISQHHYG